MKRIIKSSFAGLIIAILVLSGCTDPTSTDLPDYTVSFNSNGGTSVDDMKNVEENSKISEPTAPTKTDYSFEGWFKESDLTTIWVFSTDKVTSDITLYAKWALVYNIGDIGPGSGIVFYDDTIGYDFDGDGTIQADEKNLMAGRRYLEAAPNTWSGGIEDPLAEWGAYGVDISGLDNIPYDENAHAGTVGKGEESTNAIVTYLSGTAETGRAAQLCAAYTEGSQSDWFLPSIGELIILKSEKDTVGGFFVDASYWSSSEYHSDNAFYIDLKWNVWGHKPKGSSRVRAVRAF